MNEIGTASSERKLILCPVNAYLQSQTEQIRVDCLIVWKFFSRMYIHSGWPESIEIQNRKYIYTCPLYLQKSYLVDSY
jgi:hypothetical protein